MRVFFIFILLVISAYAQSILIINSNFSIVKYKQAQETFEKNFLGNVKSIDVSAMKQKGVKKYLYDEYPDIVYAIGSLAYQYAYKYIPEKKIFFSNILNYKRLANKKDDSGILSELHSGMQLTIIRSVLKRVSKIGVVYSVYTQDVVESLKSNAKFVGIEIVTQKIDTIDDLNIGILLKNSDALLLIADPIVFSSKDIVKDIFISAKLEKKPVIAYDKLFIKYGAVLSISTDSPTIGAQVANMMQNYIDKKDKKKIQYPVATHVVLNKKEAIKLGLDFTTKELLNIDETIE